MDRDEAEAYANQLLSHYGKQSWNEHFGVQDNPAKRILIKSADEGTTADIWRVEAHFAHINGPITYETDGDNMDGSKPEPKRDAYGQVADWLMAENIESIWVYKNGRLHQEIQIA
jgi:hypothetical protein